MRPYGSVGGDPVTASLPRLNTNKTKPNPEPRTSAQAIQARYRRKRKLFVTTETLDSAIAADAIIGDNVQPVNGNSTPAAMGIPSAL